MKTKQKINKKPVFSVSGFGGAHRVALPEAGPRRCRAASGSLASAFGPGLGPHPKDVLKKLPPNGGPSACSSGGSLDFGRREGWRRPKLPVSACAATGPLRIPRAGVPAIRFLVKLLPVFVLSVFVAMSCKDSRLSDLRKRRSENRAYDGAPPTIPHSKEELGRRDCIHCHKQGDAKSDGKYAAVTPHPNYLNCRQCHVEKHSDGVFRESNFVAYRITKTPKKAQPLGPPYIPHRLQYRENCRACHLKSDTSSEIVPGHGDRTNCTQCHVTQDASAGSFPDPGKPDK